MDILQAARILRPGSSWNFNDGKLVQAEDSTPRVKVPSDDELKTLMDSDKYSEQRVLEYPPVSQFADAYVAQENGDPAPMKAYVSACNAVKAKYPKPANKGA